LEYSDYPCMSGNTVPGETEPGTSGRRPTAAVVIPCWNAQEWIARAVQSALDQDYGDLEIIVVDDGSTDGSLDIIRSFGDRIRWLATPNRGGCAARNSGSRIAKADYLCFLDADDYLAPAHIRDMAAQTADTPDLVIAKQRLEMSQGRLLTRTLPFRPDYTPSDYARCWLAGDNAQTASILWRRAFLERIGGWNETMPRLQDIELAVRAFLANPQIRLSPSSGAVFFQHDGARRVSQQHSRTVQEVSHSYLADLSQQLASQPADVRYALGIRCYRLAGDAYRNGVMDIGDAHLRLARACGVTGHIGSARHRILAALFGYRGQVRIVKHVKSVITILRRTVKNLTMQG
jgi:hypothetical protein